MLSELRKHYLSVVRGYMSKCGFHQRNDMFYRERNDGHEIIDTIQISGMTERKYNHIVLFARTGVLFPQMCEVYSRLSGNKCEKVYAGIPNVSKGLSSFFDYHEGVSDQALTEMIRKWLKEGEQFQTPICSMYDMESVLYKNPEYGDILALPILYYLTGRKDIGIKHMERLLRNKLSQNVYEMYKEL